MNLTTELLPKEFQSRMEKLLGEEYPSFLNSYEETRRYGLRVNTLKISVEEFCRIVPFHLTSIPWIRSGFFYEKEDLPSRHPFYYAGLYYLQEPSAMTPAQVLPVTPGDRVLDLCAAPGGKATALAEKLQGKGLLVANDISASRAKALLKNLEMFGVTNSLVTSTTPFRLSEQLPEFFDKILVDAPCSGEGMFRKDPASAKDWSLSKVYTCAKRQKEIVRHAVSMLRPGGMMLYSTCTFSPEEDEQVIAYILENYPEMELLPIPMAEGFENGRPELAKEDWEETAQNDRPGQTPVLEVSDRAEDLKKCVRIFPHKVCGEGHFLALLKKRETLENTQKENTGMGNTIMERTGTESAAMRSVEMENFSLRNVGSESAGKGTIGKQKQKQKKNRKQQASSGSQKAASAEISFVTSFLKDSWGAHSNGNDMADQIELHGSRAYYVPGGLNLLNALWDQRDIQILRSGLYLGEIQKDRFEPSQALAMAFRREDSVYTDKPKENACGSYKSNENASEPDYLKEKVPDSGILNFDQADERVSRYLRGETIEITETNRPDGPNSRNGWKLICVNGYPLGWGKLVSGTLKNKYLPGWRMR
ncbi:MAG: RsmB/NOP family class I SAM-dependent RNA methyltransferase [Lachnospiraceae bacterium]|nr:RsmB/NOP family class I SAM-dependent RNA methyltransferase [Lachnospiraceae bacterium]